MTVGIVSAVGRTAPELQPVAGRDLEMIRRTPPSTAATRRSAAERRGKSSGPTRRSCDQGSGNLGIGFAVPINLVQDILPQLRNGKVIRGRIGVSLNRVRLRPGTSDLGVPTASGALVSDVPPERRDSRHQAR